MATVQIADVVVPEVFDTLPSVNSTKLTAFLESGVLIRSPMLDGYAGDAGDQVTLPFWNDLDYSQVQNISSDNPATLATPNKVAQGKQRAYTSHYNQTWQAADLVSELNLGADAIDHIRSRVDNYWDSRLTEQLINTIQGVLADNQTNDAGDMVNDIASESIAGQTVDTKFSAGALIDAAYTMGDAVGGVAAIGAHSSVVAQMAKLDKGLESVYDSDGTFLYSTYNQMRVIMDDSLPVIAGTTDGFKYVTVLFAAGALGQGQGMPRIPTEIERSALGGNGGGIEALINRKTWLLHPYGYEASEPVGNGYTQAELQDEATWNRVVDRKLVPLAFLITN